MSIPRFAFMIHPRNAKDIGRRIGNMIGIGENLGIKITPNSLVEKTILKKLSGRAGFTVAASDINIWGQAKGYLIGVLLTSQQMKDYPKLAYHRILEAMKFASNELGVDRIGLGAYTAPFTGNGVNAVREFKKEGIETSITHGDSFSGYSPIPAIEETIKLRNLKVEELNIAVVGAYGVVGRPAALFASELNPRKLILTGPSKNKLSKVSKEAENHSQGVEVIASTDNNLIGMADIIVTCTTDPGAIISPEILKEEAIVVDMAQPVNMGPEVCKARPRVLRVDGGYMKIPDVDMKFNMGTPPGTTFACMAETIVSTIVGDTEHRVGKVDLEYARFIATEAKKMGVVLAPLTNFSKPLLEAEREIKGSGAIFEGKGRLAERFASFL